jgi:TonB-linked SusC/RagA family outer membrane protein
MFNGIFIRCIYVYRLRWMPLFLVSLTSAVEVNAFQQQSKTVTGTITDESSAPLQGVNIQVKGTRRVTTTEKDGKFSIAVSSSNAILQVTFVGYDPQEITVGNQSNLDFKLVPATKQLNDVVVTGYGKSSKRDITGAVTSLAAEDFNTGVLSSPGQLLQGKVPGLNITKSGDPNAKPAVILRGPSTLREGGAQEPFYVIDGVPGASIDLVAPDDIASMDVLKDASSTAIYGSRAANGVIIITTRRAKAGQTRIAYNGYVAMEKVSKRIDMISGDELRKYLAANGQSLSPTNNDSLSNTNWQDQVQRTGISHNHNISLSGSNNNTVYGAGINYLNNEGIMRTSGLDRTIMRANVEQKAFNERLRIAFALTSSTSNQRTIPTEVYQNMLNYLPTVNIKRPDGSYTEDFSRGSYLNPVSLIDNNINKTKTKLLLANALAEVKILPGLLYTLSVSSQNEQSNNNVYYNSLSGLAVNTSGKATRSAYENSKKVIESYFNYDRTFGAHNVKLLGGYSWQEDRFGDGFGVTTQGFVNDALTYNNLALSNPPAGTVGFANNGISTLRLISYYGRVNYQYNNKYLLQASVRYDGSSAFGKNNKWGTFPAVSAGWRISSEKFMEDVSFVNDLKLRVGYGVSGNTQGFDPLIAQLRYGFTGRYYSNGQLLSAVAPVQNENPNLKWESTAMANFGLDFSLFKSRITGSVDYYDKKTSDLIYNYPVSATQYFYPILTANAGTIRNKGIEVMVNATPVVTKNFTWRTSINFAHNKNKVETLSNDIFTLKSIPTAYLGGKGQSGNWSQLIQEGLPIGTFNILHYTGKNAAGVSTFEKADHTTTIAPTTSDYILPGNAQPSLIYGWNNTFVYRKFDLNFFIRGVTGNKILNATLAGVNSPSDAKNNNIPRFTLGESYSDNNAYIISDRFMENGSYLRLDNATLGYNVKTTSTTISRLRFYVSANNLFVITKYRGIDPEINMGGLNPGIDNINYYPKTRSFIFGANIIF